MDAFELSELAEQRRESGERYIEFLVADTLSAGIYELPAGDVDPQQPHTEDEVYYVVRGRASVRVGDEDREIAAGSIVFVGAGVEHRFHSITGDLTLLVVFAPPRSSLA